MVENPLTWDDRLLGLARYVASWSKDPSTKVGAVIGRFDKTVASVGFNGFPRCVEDTPERLHDRDQKYPRTVHAELNAILHARENVEGCTMYVTRPPCAQCAAAMIQAGIARLVTPYPSEEFLSRWGVSLAFAISMLDEANIDIVWSKEVATNG